MNSVKKNITLNAWLDCNNPYISLNDDHNDQVVAFFNAEDIRQLLDDGDVCVEDFQSSDSVENNQLISNLLAFDTQRKKQCVIKIKGRSFISDSKKLSGSSSTSKALNSDSIQSFLFLS